MASRLAIVGGDAAGMSAASTARRRDPDLEVVAFERGPYTSYSACGIPYYLGGLFDDSDRLISRSADEHRANGITLHMRTEVTAVDLAARTLTVLDHQTREERTEGFDQVVVATGAEAVPPPVPGADASEPVRTVDAAERFRSALSRGGDHQHVVVVGGGYIGLEMAEALVQRNIATTLIEAAPQVMSTLDADMAAHVQDAAEGLGIRVLVSTELEEVLLDERGAPRAVRAAGETIEADHVVMATGVLGESHHRPRARPERRGPRRRPSALPGPRRRLRRRGLRGVLAPRPRAAREHPARDARQQAGAHRGRERDRRGPRVPRRHRHGGVAAVSL